jgi:uncharacterized membrane protein YccC
MPNIATAIKAALSPSPSTAVLKLEERSSDCTAALTRAGEEQVAAARDLHDAEKRGAIADADKAAKRLADADADVARLRVRRSAISAALAEARGDAAEEDAADRLSMFTAALATATREADSAAHNSVVAMLDLGRELNKYGAASKAERAARDGIARCAGETGYGPSLGTRGLGYVERQALVKAATLQTIQVCIPNPA